MKNRQSRHNSLLINQKNKLVKTFFPEDKMNEPLENVIVQMIRKYLQLWI